MRLTSLAGPLAKRGVEGEFGRAKPAHKRAKCEGPLPLAIAGMLELTPRPGQANAHRRDYDFSLGTPISFIFSAL